MLERFFRLSENNTTVRTEVVAGMTTFLTMAYIIFLQPAILSGALFEAPTGMDFKSVMTATCLSAAVATLIMGLWARYPIAQAPGMGENFLFFSVIGAAGALPAVQSGEAVAWHVALGVVFISGSLFLILSLLRVRELLLDIVSPSLRNGMAVGIGLFIAFIGLKNAGLVVHDPGTLVTLNTHFASPDLIIFFLGLFVTAALHVRNVRGSILIGIVFATALACLMKGLMPGGLAETDTVQNSMLAAFRIFEGGAFAAPHIAPTFFKMDLVNALSRTMIPFIIIFLFMDIFDTLGTLVGVSEQAGFIKDNKLPRANRAFLSDATGTVVGACLGTSTVTSFIESAAGVEQGGRTGLVNVVVALGFVLAIFFSPIVQTVGSYPPLTAPALVIVGMMMMRNVRKIDWEDYSEAVPAFITLMGIPLFYSIGDGVALGFISYPIIKLFSGRFREVRPLMAILAALLIAYFLVFRG